MPSNSPHLIAEDYRAIGGAVVAFGYLEHELLRAAIGLQGGPDKVSSDDEKRMLDDGSTLGARLQYFGECAKGRLEEDWLKDFRQKCQEGTRWRNMICHGQWERLPGGKLRVTFYRRGSVKRGHPDIAELSHADLKEIAKATFQNAKLLAQHCH